MNVLDRFHSNVPGTVQTATSYERSLRNVPGTLRGNVFLEEFRVFELNKFMQIYQQTMQATGVPRSVNPLGLTVDHNSRIKNLMHSELDSLPIAPGLYMIHLLLGVSVRE